MRQIVCTRRSALAALAGLALSVPACTWSDLFSWNGGKPTIFGYATAPNYDRRIKTVRVKIFKNPTFWSAIPVPGLEQELTLALVRAIEEKTPYKVVSGDNADTEISGSIRSFLKMVLLWDQQNEQRHVETSLLVEVIWKDLRTGEMLSAPMPRALEPLPPAGILPGQQDPLYSPVTPPGMVQITPMVAPTSPGGQQAAMNNNTGNNGTSTPPSPPATGNPFPGATPLPGAQGGVPGGPAAGPAAKTGTGPGTPPLIGVLVRSLGHYTPELGQSISTAQQENVNSMAEQIVSMMERGW